MTGTVGLMKTYVASAGRWRHGPRIRDRYGYLKALAIGDGRARNHRRFLLTLSDNGRALVLTLFDPELAIGAP